MRLVCAATLVALAVAASGGAQVAFVNNGQQLNNLVGRGVALADFNGDGALDAFVVNDVSWTSQDIRVYFGDGKGQFADSGLRLQGADARRPVVFDVDGNGRPDIILGRTAWISDGAGHFSPDTTRIQGSDAAPFSEDRLADLNGDRLPDLLVLAMGENRQFSARTLLNDGKGHFRESSLVRLPGMVAAIGLGDLNGDGAVDAVVSGWRNEPGDPCPNRLLLNDGKGQFTDSGQVFDEEGRHSHGLALADLDGDRDLDLVLVTQAAPCARLYVNDGKGHFTAGRTLGTKGVEKVGVADLDGNGTPDIFLACLGPDEVWLNDGKGVFTDSGVRLGTEWSWEYAIGDINRDGRPDLFVVNLGVDDNAPPERRMVGRAADVWLAVEPVKAK